MVAIYYVELNLVCIIFLFIFKNRINNKEIQLSEAGIIFNRLICASIIFCASDMLAGVMRGQFFVGASALIEISNLIYYEALVFISFLWMRYVAIKIGYISPFGKWSSLVSGIPLIIFTVLAIVNPFTHWIFKINEQNYYVRNYGIYVHWIITWSYFIITTIAAIKAVVKEKSKLKRQSLIPLLYFIVAPIIASLVQMLFYGVSSTQAGITISIGMISMFLQSNQILTDALTGLNNRRGFDNYIEDHLHREYNSCLTFIMMDLNDFKQINDKLGHKVGDEALKSAGDVFKQVCDFMPGRPFLCRYGGDEFIIAMENSTDDELNSIENLIHSTLKQKNASSNKPYTLSVSIGIATGICESVDTAEKILHDADQNMYINKNKYKNAMKIK